MATSNKELVLIPRDMAFTTARFLSQEEQEAYEEIVRIYSCRTRETLDIPINGSNVFKVCLLNQIVLPEGTRIATLPDLGQIVETDEDYLRGFYVDVPAVVLRSAGDYSYQQNDFLAKDLAKQMGKRNFRNPVIVTGLKVVPSKDPSYGLRFRTTDKTEVINAPELAHENNERKFTKTDERGMPIFDENGNRTLYTRKDGLSRLYLGRSAGLGSYGGHLVGSSFGGKVVVVKENESKKK